MSTQLSKEEEARWEREQYEARYTALDDGAPPPYEEHDAQDPHTNAHDNLDLKEALGQESRQEPSRDVGTTSSLPPGPLSLTLDRDLIYPSSPPSVALYHIPRLLSFRGDRVFLEKCVPAQLRENGTKRRPYDQPLYEFQRDDITSGNCVVVSKAKTTFGGRVGQMKRRGIFGNWELSYKNRLTLKFKSGKWRDSEGEDIAVEESCTTLVVKEGINEDMRDLVVAAWCAKIWRAEVKKDDLALTLTRGKGFMKTAHGGQNPSFAARFAGA
ncbi:MAG: hypothetical protein M1819_004862 [Sarea resinae]|nr:MAG: hypothetical protein M1819_004862 [Sarea resinae]